MVMLGVKRAMNNCNYFRQSQISGIPSEVKPQIRLGAVSLMKAGLVAGITQKCISYPLDLLSVRIALGVNTSTLGEKSYDVR